MRSVALVDVILQKMFSTFRVFVKTASCLVYAMYYMFCQYITRFVITVMDH